MPLGQYRFGLDAAPQRSPGLNCFFLPSLHLLARGPYKKAATLIRTHLTGEFAFLAFDHPGRMLCLFLPIFDHLLNVAQNPGPQMWRLMALRHRSPPLPWRQSLREVIVPTSLLFLAVPLLLVIAAVPLFVSRFPPLGDYPNHLARMYILAEYNKIPQFHAAYELDWAVLPNLAMDLLVPPLVGLVGIEVAGLFFIFTIFLATVTGALLINRMLYGYVSIGSLFSFCILYNGILDWGLMNFLFGMGLSLIGFGIYLIADKKGVFAKIVLSSCMSFIIFICHLYAFAVYGILILCYELVNFHQNSLVRNCYKNVRTLVSRLIVSGVQAILP